MSSSLGLAAAGLGWSWAGSCLGAFAAWLPARLSGRTQAALLGVASGVMLAAALLSLLPQAMHSGALGVVLAGFLAGLGLMALLDAAVPHQHAGAPGPDHRTGGMAPGTGVLIALALTLHNIPEGLAVGLAALAGQGGGQTHGVVIAIALHNVLEGILVAVPLRLAGFTAWSAFGMGQFAAIAEVGAGVSAVLLVGFASWLLPAGLACAAGAMVFVVLEDIYPEALRAAEGNAGPAGAVIGVTVVVALTGLSTG